MHLKTTLVVLAAAAVCAVSASAGSAAKSPLSLVLQRSDFQAKTQWSAARSPSIDTSLAAAGLRET